MSRASERVKSALFVVLAPIYLPILLSLCVVLGVGIYVEDRVRGWSTTRASTPSTSRRS